MVVNKDGAPPEKVAAAIVPARDRRTEVRSPAKQGDGASGLAISYLNGMNGETPILWAHGTCTTEATYICYTLRHC